MPVNCWIDSIWYSNSASYRDQRLLITFMLRDGFIVDNLTTYPQEKLSTACDRSYWVFIQDLLLSVRNGRLAAIIEWKAK